MAQKAKIIFPELLGDAPTQEEIEEVETESAEIDKEYGEHFDVRELMQSARDPLTGSLRDLKIDDRDLDQAKNYYDWIFRVSGSKTRPWSRQMWIMLKLFGEICPRCTKAEYYEDMYAIDKNMESEELSYMLQILDFGVCPGCGGTKQSFVKDGHMRLFDELVLCWGQRSGKSTTAVSAGCYHLHRFLKFPVFGSLISSMDEATPLTASFVSLSYGKAVKVLWQPFKSMVANIPWFVEMFKLLDFYSNQYGEELYSRKKEFLYFAHKNLILEPTSSTWTALRGDTRFMAMIDELGLFRLPDENTEDEEGEDESRIANADEAHKSLDNSLLTVRNAAEHLLLEKNINGIPTGILLGVSSPSSPRDKVMRLLNETKTEIGGMHMLGSQMPTWEINPTITRNSRVIINAYAKNANKAERDFGANPSTAASSYLAPPTLWPIISNKAPTHTLRIVYGTNKEMWAVAEKKRNVSSPTIMVLDAGYVNNSFAISCFSLNESGKPDTETICEIVPREGFKINFNKLYLNAILPMVKDNFSVLMAADQWQSLDTLARFATDSLYRKAKIKRFSMSRRHFDAVRILMEDEGIFLPKPELDVTEFMDNPDTVTSYRAYFRTSPVAHLIHQFLTIRDVGPTKSPEKGIGWTDDLARAWFLGAFLMQDPNVRLLLEDAVKFMPRTANSTRALGVFRGRSSYGL